MKLFFFDCETTGLDPVRNDMVQLSYIIEIDKKVVLDRNLFLRPHRPENIDPEALKTHGMSFDTIMSFPDRKEAYNRLEEDLAQFCDKYDKTDKYFPVAFCGHFDFGFLTALYKELENPYLGSYLDHRNLLDPSSLARFMSFFGWINVPNHKLVTLCKYFLIPIKAHDALSDTKAMRELFHILVDRYKVSISAEPLGNRKDEIESFPEHHKTHKDLDVVLDNFNKSFAKAKP